MQADTLIKVNAQSLWVYLCMYVCASEVCKSEHDYEMEHEMQCFLIIS